MCLVAWRLVYSGARAGLALSWGLVWYGCSRGLVDFLRAYDASSTLGEFHGYAIPISQVSSVLLVLIGAGIAFGLRSRRENRHPVRPRSDAMQLGGGSA
jgi:prolipoprotein diacylglyceryltransferase